MGTNISEYDKPQRKGWAQGSYLCVCNDCKVRFLGDKRAWQCAPCAYKDSHGAPTAERGE